VNSPPWAQIGALQQEVDAIRSELHRKVDYPVLDSLNRQLDTLGRSLWETSRTLDEILSRLQTCENQIAEGRVV